MKFKHLLKQIEMKKIFGILMIAFMALLLSQPLAAKANPDGKVLTSLIADTGGGDLIAQASTATVAAPDIVSEPVTVVVSDLPAVPDPVPFNLWTFLLSYWAELLIALMAFIKVIVRITPTLKDDAIFGYLDKLIEWLVPNLTVRK
jgi:hypothetical protein